MQNTPSAGIPYPEDSDLPETNVHLQSLATSVDAKTIPRFASASARNAAIPSPANGQAAYLQDTEVLTVYKTGYGAWMDQGRPFIMKMKGADEALSNNSTFQDDNHIVSIVLKANTWYTIKGNLWYASGATEDIKFQMSWTSAPSINDSFWCIKNNRSSFDTEYRSATATGAIIPATNGSFTHSGIVEGIVLTPGVSTTVKLQWAQNVSGAATTTVFAGSYLEFTEAF